MTSPAHANRSPLPRLWFYTNFDCNLACSYCLASSSPRAPRRAIPFDEFRDLIDQADEAGIEEFFLTGGEPFLLPDIFDRLEYAAQRRPTTVLTNGMLLTGRRFRRLAELKDLPITLQVSLDGECAPCHDAFRGDGSWAKTVAVIQALVAAGLRTTIGATETVANRPHIDRLPAFARGLGIEEDGVFVRPLTKRGFSQDGLALTHTELVPELTVTADGTYWHPQSAGEAMLVSRSLSPLGTSLAIVRANFEAMRGAGGAPMPYRCA